MGKKNNVLSSVLLTVIRNRRNGRPGTSPDAPVLNKPAIVRQREAHFSDFEQVTLLKKRCGLSEDSIENWYRLWKYNPALCRAQGPLSLGWVLEVEQRIVGYLGSIPLLYHYGQKPLVAATASGFAVEPAYRAFSLGLVASFYRQSHVDLFLNTTAIESVGKLAGAFRAEVLPQLDYDQVLFWVIDGSAFAEVLRKKVGLNGIVGTIGRSLGSLSVKAETALRRRHPLRATGTFRIASGPIANIGCDFEEVWQQVMDGKPRLLADRDSFHLEWHFSIPKSEQVIRVLRCEKAGQLVGYAILRMETERETGLRRSFLADLLVKGDDAAAIQSLISAAYGEAKEAGCHLFEVLGFPASIREVLQKGKPYSRRFPAPPFYFKAREQSLQDALRVGDAWYACPFDGDTTLMP